MIIRFLSETRSSLLILVINNLQGILIGYVSEVTVDSNNLTRSGYITPAVDFKNLQEVLVITTTKADWLDPIRANRSEYS